jgi:hypothetical protein
MRDRAAAPRIDVPDWLTVESLPVHVEAEREVSWRLRVARSGSGNVSVTAGTERASKRIEARPGLHYLPDRETASAGPILWLESPYPAAELAVLGVSARWPVWFFVISSVTALAFRNRLRVTL